MDARSVCATAGIAVTTLNVWIQRGVIPGWTVTGRGRERDFDFETALRIAITSELVRLGISAKTAGMFVFPRNPDDDRGFYRRLLFVRAPATVEVTEAGTERWPARELCFGFSSEEEIPQLLTTQFPYGFPAAGYAVINVEVLGARMQRAWEQWEQSRSGAR
jgi:hypothetical protein